MGNLPKIKVALDLEEMDVTNLASMAKGVKTTGDPDVTNPSVTDLVLHGQADDLLDCHDQRGTNKSPSLTRQETVLKNILIRSVTDVGLDVEKAANKVAIAQGDVAAGEAVVLRCGYKLKKKGTKPPREFEVVGSGPGWVHIRVKSVGSRAGYVWRFGITTEIGKVPTIFMPMLFTLECEVIITNIPRGAILGYQMASIVPVNLTAKSSPNPDVSKIPPLGAPSKGKKPTFTANVDPLHWSDFIYDVCK